MEFQILKGALSWFPLELSLLEETVESLEASLSAEIADMARELEALRPDLDAEWKVEDAQDIQDENRDPLELEVRYAALQAIAPVAEGSGGSRVSRSVGIFAAQ